VTVVVLPPETTVGQLAAAGFSPGLMSTGIGQVPAEQTYLDISQGNRVANLLYDGWLARISISGPSLGGWQDILDRAGSAPASIEPGLLGLALIDAGVGSRVTPFVIAPAVIAADQHGTVARASPGPGMTVEEKGLPRKRVTRMARGDLLIAFAEPVSGHQTVPIGIAGGGFHGNLTSDSTRTDGYVLSTDVAPTILRRFGLPIPDEMDGEPIRAEGSPDAVALGDLADRMAAIPDRREPILVACILAWLLTAFALYRLVPGLRRAAMAWLALCFAYMPLTLLVGAWLEPSALVEGLLVGLGAAGLAALTLRFGWGWRGLAVACGITVAAYAIDVIAGSGLTRLSLLGPNPIYGVRFYGIGNELEALIAVMVPVGVGAGLSAWSRSGKPVNERGAVLAFAAAGLLAAAIFAAGRFGADVGAAIVLPVGAAAATLSLGPIRTKSRRSLVLAVAVVTPFIALAFLALIDLVSGGNSHLTRSVLDAGGTGDLADLAERRFELSAHDFARAAANPLFWIVVVGICVAATQWRRITAWLGPAPMARAGLVGACAAVAVGVLVNDSGASFLVLGALGVGAFLAFAWSQAGGDR
jgi:hypothetical protein